MKERDQTVKSPPVPSSSSISPRKQSLRTSPTKQNQYLPHRLPSRLQPYLQSQKNEILKALHSPPSFVEDGEPAGPSAFDQLSELLNGTIQRNEGNSCLVLGAKGSGKTMLVDHVLASHPSTSTPSPVTIRLSAFCQTNDRLAMREIARQVHRQMGSESSLPALPTEIQDFEESGDVEDYQREDVELPPPSHLPLLISALPGLGRPVIVVLDAFDGFATHVRQALLYCLLDTVQSCRGGAPLPLGAQGIDLLVDPSADEADKATELADNCQRNSPEAPGGTLKGESGLLVIGVTSRVDCLEQLEKRVKSRFSHRIIRVRRLQTPNSFLRFTRAILCVQPEFSGNAVQEWSKLWAVSVDRFLNEKNVVDVLKEALALTKDPRMLCRLLISTVLALTPDSPWLTSVQLLSEIPKQWGTKRFPFLLSLPYPHIALLIAATHIQVSGHDTFNFEMLYDLFAAQVRTSVVAPIQIAGNALGMVKVPRGVMVGAFEHLVTTRVFQPAAAPASHITREFVRFRCIAERDEIKAAVDHLGQTNLRKWFYKAQ